MNGSQQSLYGASPIPQLLPGMKWEVSLLSPFDKRTLAKVTDSPTISVVIQLACYAMQPDQAMISAHLRQALMSKLHSRLPTLNVPFDVSHVQECQRKAASGWRFRAALFRSGLGQPGWVSVSAVAARQPGLRWGTGRHCV